jgi:hypothetical protein
MMRKPLTSSPLLIGKLLSSLLALGIVAIGVSFLRIVHGTPPPYGAPGDIGSAAFFPGLVALLVTGLGVVMLLGTWRANANVIFERGRTGLALIAFLLMLAMALLINVAGIWLVSMLAVPLLAVCFGEKRWYVLLALAVIPPTVVIHLFEGVMGIYFPRGMLL